MSKTARTGVDENEDQGAGLFSCTICNVTVSSEAVLNSHLRGRPHQFNLDKRRSAERSVYVRGFPKYSTIKDDLQSFFEQFGKVKSIWLPGSYVFAIVEFVDEKCAEHVLHAREPLLINGRRLTVKPRDIKVRGKPEEHRHGDDREPGDQEHHSTSNHRGRRFKGHPNKSSGGYFEEQRFKFDPEVQQKLAAVNSAEEQLKLICSYYKMPVSAIRAHLNICATLTAELQSKFPNGLVVPFGAAISGHGTMTSDCDICLFTNLSEQERALFTLPNYQPRDLKPALSPPPTSRASQLTSPPPMQAAASPFTSSTNTTVPTLTSRVRESCSPAGDDVQSSSSEASGSPAASPLAPPRGKPTSTSRTNFDMVASSIRSMADCSKILAIPHARCPIVRFVYDPANIHCDLSIDNVLGPANTRLMQAYTQFDERFALLVPFVRLWVKHNGPPRTQLNSYAVSLMLIYCLQRCTPPVLPCLQSPGTWPKNMDWFSKHGFQQQQQQQQRLQLTVGPWSCDFVPPDSLLPSTNTQTPVELLLHFFKFYSEWRPSEEVVAIHCPPDKTLSPSAAKALATAPKEQGYKIRPFNILASFIIQDPFEFDHNLCKALSKPNYTAFIHHLKIAAELLASNKSLLPLFDRKEYQKVEVRLYSKPKRLVFNTSELKQIFQGNPSFSALGEGLETLDMTDSFIHQSVSLVALKAITEYLQQSLGFSCSADNSNGDSQEESYHDDDDVNTDNSAGVKSEAVENTASSERMDVDRDGKGTAVEPEPPSTREKKQVTNREASVQGTNGGEASTRKRAHDTSDDEPHDETKRTKKGNSHSVKTLDILRQVQQECQSAKYVCTAVNDTWTHRRLKRRKLEQQKKEGEEEENMDTNELTESLPPLPALLSVRMLTESSKAPLVSIEIYQLPPLKMNKFNNWFTLINKELHGHSPSGKEQHSHSDKGQQGHSPSHKGQQGQSLSDKELHGHPIYLS